MASRTLSRYHDLLSVARYPPLHSFPYVTVEFPQQAVCIPKSQEIPSKRETKLSERFVLEELSSILPIDYMPPSGFSFNLIGPQPPNASDYLLLPDEKLRGIFLQKFNGKFALESALSATGVYITREIFSNVLNKGNMGGAAIVSFFTWAIEHSDLPKTIETYNAVLNALGKRKFFGYLVEVSLEMKKNGVQPDLKTLEIIFDSFIRACQVSKAVKLFKRIEDIGADRDTKSLNIILKCLCSRSHVGVASSLLSSMRGEVLFNKLTYNEIIGGWAKFGMIDKVEKYWTAMVADNLKPDCRTFCHLIEALGRSGRITSAVDTFSRMEERGCIPDTSVYNVMISNFISIGDIEEALNYYKRMPEKNCTPDTDTYKILIKAFLKVRKVADSLELFDEMLGQGINPSAGMITSFIEPLCKFGPPHAAMKIYKTAKKAGCRVSLKAYKLLFMRLSSSGNGGMLMKLWEEMLDSGYTLGSEIYGHIVGGLCNTGRVENAVLVMHEALRNGCCPGRIVYSQLNNKLLAMNKVETAYKLFLKIKDVRNNANSHNFWRCKGWAF